MKPGARPGAPAGDVASVWLDSGAMTSVMRRDPMLFFHLTAADDPQGPVALTRSSLPTDGR